MSEEKYVCPTCGSEVVVGKGCPVCAAASKPQKSWEQDEAYDGIDLPDPEFDYEEFVQREFSSKPHREVGIKLYWWVTATVLVIVLVWMFAAR